MSTDMHENTADPASNVLCGDKQPAKGKKGFDDKNIAREAALKTHELRRQRRWEKALSEYCAEAAEHWVALDDPGTVPREPGMWEDLYDMRHVVARPARADFSQMQRGFRKLMIGNLTQFARDKARREDEWRAKQEGKAAGPELTDIGEEKALKLLDEALASKGWNMAKCPKCGERFDLTKCES